MRGVVRQPSHPVRSETSEVSHVAGTRTGR
jgi:hypothetical protein